MVTDQQSEAYEVAKNGADFGECGGQSGMDEKTARKYLRPASHQARCGEREVTLRELTTLPECGGVGRAVRAGTCLEALTLMEHLCAAIPRSVRDGAVTHTAAAGEALAGGGGTRARSFLPPEHPPGRQAQSDFTHMKNWR